MVPSLPPIRDNFAALHAYPELIMKRPPAHVNVVTTHSVVDSYATAHFTGEDVEHIDQAISDIIDSTSAIALPGLAYVRNKIAARVGLTLITGDDNLKAH